MRAAEGKHDWWHDVKRRGWTVQRPFGPGVIDSTHWFNVTYQIDGKPVAKWFVDTRKREVRQIKLPKPTKP